MTHRLLTALAVLAAAALAACGSGRGMASAAQAECTGCHGDASRTGSALLKAAPPVSPSGGDGGAHLAHLERGVACGACHVVPTSPAHSDGVVQVRFSGAAVAHGATPAYASGTCSGVYCHGATLGAGGKGIVPSWADGPLGCDACHGAPPPSHAATSTSCHDCHPGTVKADGTIDVAGGLHANGVVDVVSGHPAGWADPAQHGASAKLGLASCRSCHGAALDGVGGSGPSCETCHASAGYPSWQTNCTFCHGALRTSYDPSNLSSAAPPRGSAGETATTQVAVGAHARHLSGGAIGPAVACTDCHVVPTDLAHVGAGPTVTFGAGATRGNASPSWNGAGCAATYCHGGTLAGGTNTVPTWTKGSGETTCGSCHGLPPSTGHHGEHSGRSCGDCHPGYSTTTVNLATHVNGTKEVGNQITAWNPTTRQCTGCHGNATW
jgi:predicted CxxxxCH...CXXCH cytochrome family protein